MYYVYIYFISSNKYRVFVFSIVNLIKIVLVFLNDMGYVGNDIDLKFEV